jgi:hypothetical protein
MKDRFDLEERISKLLDISENIEDLIYMVGDSPNKPTEDDLLNALIGLKSTLDVRYDRLWNTFEELIKNGQLKSNQIDE